MPTLVHGEAISNHGTSTGIQPRFFLQMLELWRSAFDGQDGTYEKNTTPYYMEHFIPTVETLYDIYHEIIDINKDYIEGLKNGTYFKKDMRGQTSTDRTKEQLINYKVKDFFIYCRLLILQWYKSHVVFDEFIDLGKLLIVNDENFEKVVNDYLSKDNMQRYKTIYELIERARNKFLNDLSKHRVTIEHSSFKLDKFRIEDKGEYILVYEPYLDNRPIMQTLEFYYVNLLDLIEKIMVYYYGINAIVNKKIWRLYIRRDNDYTQLKYKYNFHIGNLAYAYEADPCLYD